MKITTLSIIVMFLASVLIIPVGMSYALTGNVTASTPSVNTMTNQTGMNKTMTNQTGMNKTMTNQTGMNKTMTNQTGVMNSGMNKTLTSTNSTVSPPVVVKPKMLLPLEQVKAGIAPKDVQCKQGYSLILKAEDGSAACVDPTVAQVLALRGWSAHP